MTASPTDRHDAARLLLAWGQGPLRRVLAGMPDRPGATVSLGELVEVTGLDTREAAVAAGRAVDLGLLTRDADGRFAVGTDALRRLADSLVEDSPLPAIVERRPALAAFVTAGRLTGWPTRPDLVEECFAGIAEALPQDRWQESELTDWLGLFSDDPAGLRRGLVDRGLLLRAPGSDRLRIAQTG